MQAEEIIQQKEWEQLSENEREFLKELTANEQEYNLLKKMLQLSAEEALEVPLFNEKTKLSLDTVINKNKLNSNRFVWYAAAAVLLIFFSTLLVYNYNRTTKQPAFVETKAPFENLPSGENKVTIGKNDSLQKNADESKNVADAKIRLDSNSSGNKINFQTAPLLSNTDKYSAINTTIKADPRLLSLVTEVY